MGSDDGPGLAYRVSIFRQKSIGGIKRDTIMVDASIINHRSRDEMFLPFKPLTASTGD